MIRGFGLQANISELHSSLGLCNLYRRIVLHSASTAASLNAKLKKGKPKPFGFDEVELAVMEQQKEKLRALPILALPTREGKVIMDTEACDKQVGCVLQLEKITFL